jgi:hypothetical protein
MVRGPDHLSGPFAKHVAGPAGSPQETDVLANRGGTTGSGRYCCKSRKSPGDNFTAKGPRDRRPSISVLSIALPRSPVSLRSGDEVPHILYTEVASTAQRILISSAKRLLQQYRPGRHILPYTRGAGTALLELGYATVASANRATVRIQRVEGNHEH